MIDKNLRGIAKISDNEKEFLLEYYVVKSKKTNIYTLEIDKSLKNSLGELNVCEKYVSTYGSYNCKEMNDVADLLIKNSVTPITADSILQDIKYSKK